MGGGATAFFRDLLPPEWRAKTRGGMTEALKDWEFEERMVPIRSRMKAADEPLLEQLADSLLA